MKKTRDVKHNTVYYANWNSIEYLVLYDENRLDSDHYIRINRDLAYGSNAVFSGNGCFLYYLHDGVKKVMVEHFITIREATPIEDRWLRKCIEIGRYVDCPKEEIINDYQIY